MRYSLTIKTQPASEPVTRQEAKDHLHETDTAQDAVIDGNAATIDANSQVTAITDTATCAACTLTDTVQ
ncbi:MAG: hypothetical protein ACHP79_15965, partial [Terriglobales bacterium]